MLDRKPQFVPTDLGLARVEETSAWARWGSLLGGGGVWTVTRGEPVYAVVNLARCGRGRRRIYWRAVPMAWEEGRSVNTTLTALRQAMTDFLAGRASPPSPYWGAREEGTTPVAVVRIQEVRASGGDLRTPGADLRPGAQDTRRETYGQQVG